jgi:hypothetical protein
MMDYITEGRVLVGKRIELPVHYDMWMRGGRYGRVTAFRHGKPGQSCHVIFQPDNAPSKRVKVWALDFYYCRVL